MSLNEVLKFVEEKKYSYALKYEDEIFPPWELTPQDDKKYRPIYEINVFMKCSAIEAYHGTPYESQLTIRKVDGKLTLTVGCNMSDTLVVTFTTLNNIKAEMQSHDEMTKGLGGNYTKLQNFIDEMQHHDEIVNAEGNEY